MLFRSAVQGATGAPRPWTVSTIARLFEARIEDVLTPEETAADG